MERRPELLGPVDYPLFQQQVLAVPAGLESYKALETIDPAAASSLMRAAQQSSPLPAVPLRVISRTVSLGLPGPTPRYSNRVEAAWRRGHQQLAGLTSSGVQILAQSSSHYVQLQQPDLVIQAAREVIEAAAVGPPADRPGPARADASSRR